MIMFEMVMVALRAIRTNMLRAVLTTLGIVIGISAVIAMVALGEGAQRSVEAEINRIGTTVLTIRPGQQFARGVSRGDAQMSIDDAIALKSASGDLLTVSPEQKSQLQIAYLRWNAQIEVLGVWPEYFQIYNYDLLVGRFFNQSEVQGKRRVVVLGHNIPALLGDTPAELLVGQTIQVNGISCEVIGVLMEKGDAAFIRPDDQVFMPQSTAQYRVMGGRDALGAIYAATATPDELDTAYTEIDRVLRREHRLSPDEDSDFNIRNSADLLQTARQPTLQRDQPNLFTAAGGYRRCELARWWDGDHEHHARIRHGKDPRDRCAKSLGRHAGSDHGPVPGRGVADLPNRRPSRDCHGIRGSRTHDQSLGLGLGGRTLRGRRRFRVFRRDRPLLRHLARAQGFPNGSDRRP